LGHEARSHRTLGVHARSRQGGPEITVDEDRIFVVDGQIWTSAGMSAGLDLALALVEKDLGPKMAKAIARKRVIYQRRAGGQWQFSALLDLDAKSDACRRRSPSPGKI
jgi:transcriptional regulator GlxA family with amidase domain